MAMMNGNEPLLSVVLELSWHYLHDFEIFLISLPICIEKFQSFASNRKVVSDNMQARKLVF